MKRRERVAEMVERQRGALSLRRSPGRGKSGATRSLAGCVAVAVAIAFAAMTVPPASGALGGDVTSVEADRAKMEATLRTTSKQMYTIQEMHAANDVTVREFVSPAGKVFGVAWQGASRPDMKQLLGTYFDQYTQAAQSRQAKRVGRGPLVIQQPGLVLQMGGHMRALVGRAYVPQMVPAGVNLEEIR